jgi:beta-N-acetylhexosaminidase
MPKEKFLKFMFEKQKTEFMHSRRSFIKLNMATMALLTGCIPDGASHPPNTPMPNVNNPNECQNDAQASGCDTTEVSLDVKIGQMLLVGFRGFTVKQSAPIVQDIQDRQIGGVILFDYDVAQKRRKRNIQSPAQVRALVEALQGYSKTPLLVAIDYEGGKINRLREQFGFPATFSHQYFGEKNDPAFTYKEASKMAQTLADLGINLNFAPVVDVNTNPDNPIIGKLERSFSADPDIVTKHAIEYIKAHHSQKILCSLKHFPGHGSSVADSHLGMADVTETWAHLELEPYKKMIQAGEVDAIMTAHVFNKTLDPNDPATLSKPTVTGLLRKQLGFEGIVFSDDMQMKAIASHYGLETAVRKVIEAGVDILVIGNNTGDFVPDIAERVIAIIKGLVQNGTLSEQRIEESYQRILLMKQRL